jgi:hypothetical protein
LGCNDGLKLILKSLKIFAIINQMFLTFVQIFLNYSRIIIPWFAFGVVIAYLIEKSYKQSSIEAHFSQINLKKLLILQVLGMISPMSILSLLPVASEFIAKGFNPGLLLSFFIAERAYDLQSFFIITGLFGFKFAFLNFVAILASLIFTALFIKNDFINFYKTKSQLKHNFVNKQVRLFILVILGIFLGAILRSLIPHDLFQAYTGGTLSGIGVSLLLGFLLYFGPILGNYPIAKAFSDLGMSQAGAFSFLTVSPILNIVVITIFGATVGYKKTIKAFLIYSAVTLFLSLAFSQLLNL